jgi:pimeloyl-ACP methyl ester carboxylesterase
LPVRRRGRGPRVVFLGGAPTPWDVLGDVAAGITSAFEAIELALPGYAPDAPPLGPHTLADVTNAIASTLAAEGVEACALVGFSGGAYRALDLAMRGAPRVTHVLALAGMARLEEGEAAIYRGLAQSLRSGPVPQGVAAARFLSQAFAAAHPSACAAVEAWLHAAPAAAVADELDAFAGARDLLPSLASLRAPVVARVGSLDVAAPPPKSEAIASACADGTLEVVPGAGHALPIEDRERTIASLLALLRR